MFEFKLYVIFDGHYIKSLWHSQLFNMEKGKERERGFVHSLYGFVHSEHFQRN